jgi:hypothetical protein
MKLLGALIAVSGWMIGIPVRAEITAQDLQIAARALSFMEMPLAGRVRAGIVYSSGDPRSVRQADALQRMLGQGLQIGNVELRPVRIEIGEVARADVDIFLLTDYTGAAGAQMAAVSAAKMAPCITTDLAQVRDGACVMGIRSTPKVEIMVNRAAATNTGIKFAGVFRMLITEL